MALLRKGAKSSSRRSIHTRCIITCVRERRQRQNVFLEMRPRQICPQGGALRMRVSRSAMQEIKGSRSGHGTSVPQPASGDVRWSDAA